MYLQSTHISRDEFIGDTLMIQCGVLSVTDSSCNASLVLLAAIEKVYDGER